MPFPAHLDRDEALVRAPESATPPGSKPADETGVHDLSAMWRDLGGSD